MQDLSQFNNISFSRGSSVIKELIWRLTQWFFFRIDFITAYAFKSKILRFFGAKIERNITWKPLAKVTFPWKLSIGENSWIGEEVWMLNLAPINLGKNVCISQRAFLCTGSHHWSKRSFDLIVKPITIENGVWICANVFVGAGVTIGENTLVTAGSVVNKDLPPNMICSGNPCVPIKPRVFE
ncbi:MAG: putative colanic acid biosynthesis acetyltransferase WcaF [Oleiphilaceae bacterium]|jgi:putative colanic acid biosynthesis acetyltransferase WcaF